jgi:hypothetical protein
MKAIIDMATITTGFAGCRADRGHRKMLTFQNTLQHFREIDERLRRIRGNSEIDPLGKPFRSHQKPSKPFILLQPDPGRNSALQKPDG